MLAIQKNPKPKAPSMAIVKHSPDFAAGQLEARERDRSPPPPAVNRKVVAFEIIEAPHERVSDNTIITTFRCLGCQDVTAVVIPVKKTVKQFAIGATITFNVTYDLEHSHPVCRGCGGKFRSK